MATSKQLCLNSFIFLIAGFFQSEILAQPTSYCSGLMDMYTCPEEPVTPDPALLNLFISQNSANPCFGLLEFDNFPGTKKCNGAAIAQNTFFIHQVAFPVTSGSINSATLRFRAKAAPIGLTGTDFISFFEGATFITGANISQLIEAGGTWNNNQDANFTLDLNNLPPVFSVNSILQYLNDGDLDIVIGNETGVDWMCLDVVTGFSTIYLRGPIVCRYKPPSTLVWIIKGKYIDSGRRDEPSTSPYHLQTAILKPTSLPVPQFVLTDSLENPLKTTFGEEIILVADNAVASKIEAISPAPPGYEWYGLVSNSLTPSGSPNADTTSFIISFEWLDAPGSQNSTGAFWMSDDKDDLYQELVIDAFALLDTAEVISSQNEIGLSGSLHIFPNPTTGSLNIELPFPSELGMSLQVGSLTGQNVFNKDLEVGSAVQTIDASALPQGMYFIQILSKGQVIAVNKFVKQ